MSALDIDINVIVTATIIIIIYQNGWTPLHWASSKGHADIVYRLLTGGADPTAKNNVSDEALIAWDLKFLSVRVCVLYTYVYACRTWLYPFA